MRPIHAIKWTLTSQAFRGVIQLLQLFLLARILGPSQYGLVALATAFTNFALIFSDLGLTAAYVQSQNISSNERNTLFTCNVALAGVIFIAIIVFSPFIAYGLGMPMIEPLIKLTAPIIIITALGQQVRASAEKNLNFRLLAINEIAGNAIGFITTITLAWNGSGASSIVWGTITYALINTALPWIQFPTSMKPRLVTNLKVGSKHLTYGINTLANGILVNLTLNSDLFLSSRIIGETAMGSYSLPRNLTLQIQAIANPPLNRAAFPIFAKAQKKRTEISQLFKAITALATALNTPLYLTLFFYAKPIIYTALGQEWSGSIDLLKIFAIWGIMRTCLNPPGTLLLALDKAHSLRNWNLIVFVITGLATILAAPHGAATLALALTFLTGLQVLLIWFVLIRRYTDVGFFEYFSEISFPVALGVASIGGISYLNPIGTSTMLHLFLQSFLSTLPYFLMGYVFLRKNISKLK